MLQHADGRVVGLGCLKRVSMKVFNEDISLIIGCCEMSPV